ncbi:HK97 family phage prohead protease [Pseudaestuariivita atlantica]|uniref:Peptidase U35 n=1 Tax=Pseudaestuariivita atlantica TaxID=1317121 RepID=A0A0L1JLX6_9RHOB|nr:HK97 family phage prohead protease [Pseudaestuariivita atlantica]KNG92759.1 peptidase U35 [Pseudaestuariivita atlantica]
MELERKFARLGEDVRVIDGTGIEGYASLFGQVDQGGDVVTPGAYKASLGAKRKVKMLWQHDPAQPIGVWDEVREDARGLYVKGRLLDSVAKGREAAALLDAGAIEGLSIGYRTVKAARDEAGRRLLTEVELWEVSLVTFPMQREARVAGKGETLTDAVLTELAVAFDTARQDLGRARRAPNSKAEGSGT